MHGPHLPWGCLNRALLATSLVLGMALVWVGSAAAILPQGGESAPVPSEEAALPEPGDGTPRKPTASPEATPAAADAALRWVQGALSGTAQAPTTTGAAPGKSTSPRGGPLGPSTGLGLLVGMTVLSVAPALLMCFTSFTRISIVLTFLRQGLGTSTVPPNTVLAGLAFLLTLFSMRPTLEAVINTAATPYMEGRIDVMTAAQKAYAPAKDFMLRQTRQRDLALFARLEGRQGVAPEALPAPTIAAAFLLSELKSAFQIGLVILLPFLLVDLLVSLAMTALGLNGPSPATISVPLKLALFVAIDGWNLVIGSLLTSFR